jgi:hypothetical protein
MADTNSEEEPSIEEILASIRQIISDDEDEEAEEEALESPIREHSDDVLELTEDDLVEQEPEDEPVEPPIEVDMRDKEEEPEEEDPEEEEDMDESDPRDIIEEIRAQNEEGHHTVPSDILSSAAQSAALSSMSKLKSKMPINNPRSYDGVTLEDIVREMLHPMLREWMDDNLPPMVERIVQKELEKLARRAFDD